MFLLFSRFKTIIQTNELRNIEKDIEADPNFLKAELEKVKIPFSGFVGAFIVILAFSFCDPPNFR